MRNHSLILLFVMGVVGCENTVQLQGGGGAGGEPPCADDDACTCDAVPVCESYEVEAATCVGSIALSCREVTVCGQTIFCEEYETCTAVPVCDEGDDQVPACPNDGTPCYQVELCGAVISCADNGLAHGCPPSPPAPQESCTELGLQCDYPLNNGCIESWTCIDPTLGGNGTPGGMPGGGGGSGADEQPVAPYIWESSGTVCQDGV